MREDEIIRWTYVVTCFRTNAAVGVMKVFGGASGQEPQAPIPMVMTSLFQGYDFTCLKESREPEISVLRI